MSGISITDTYDDKAVSVRALDGSGHIITPSGTSYVAIQNGTLRINDSYNLTTGMYTCLPECSTVSYFNCRALYCNIKTFTGIFTVGGPIEKTGRLRYINGCSDTTIIAPLKLGNPCLNYLHFPPLIDQTPHTHPSLRAGIIIKGFGICKSNGFFELMETGNIFIIPKNSIHSFHTDHHKMDIVVFHPDSVFGPTDDTHQMLAATVAV